MSVTKLLAEQWRQRAAHFESSERLRELADRASFGAWLAKPDHSCFYVNRKWLDDAGGDFADYTDGSFQEQHANGWLARIHPLDRERCRQNCEGKFKLHRSYQNEYRLCRPDGSYVWVLDEGVPRFNAKVELIGYAGTVVDLSDVVREIYRRSMERKKPRLLYYTIVHELAHGHLYTCRRWYRRNSKAVRIDDAVFAKGPTLESVRAQLPAGLRNIGRDPGEDPRIVETWVGEEEEWKNLRLTP
jgi:PAS domain S-box-containing protein